MAPYGAIEEHGVEGGTRRAVLRGAAERRPALALAALCLLCLAGMAWVVHRGGHRPLDLVSMGSLGQDEQDMDAVDSDIQNELNKNTVLSHTYKAVFTGGAGMPGAEGGASAEEAGAGSNCKCDCSAKPQLASMARKTMLEQVGDNVFFGKCASCPCLRSSSIEAEVARLSKELNAETTEEDGLNSKEKAHRPVEIVLRTGAKGLPGKRGPTGFQGADGDAGARGPQGPTGPRGDRGPPGVNGPRGYKGKDGPRGGPGPDGPPGIRGEPGQRGKEGFQGYSGSSGPPGISGSNGPTGQRGMRGKRGQSAPKYGLRGPTGAPGEQGVKGEKGPQGYVGDKGFIGNPGPDGADGIAGGMGERGKTGKGCDGVVPPSGESPKVIDACGVCGGDESECANTRSMRTAYAVGDPHYRTFDGNSFDYQVTGEFILARHMNDIELQNMQMPCPNSAVRCNIGAAVITKNVNVQFRSEWANNKIMVNGERWTRGQQFQNCRWLRLDLNAKLYVCNNMYQVAFNDKKSGDGALVYGYMYPWGNPLPNRLYHNIYFNAPGRWSSGLSMTGLFANFNNNGGDDWDAIAPSNMWWVKGTGNSAFSNPKYLLTWDNRIKKKGPNKPGSPNPHVGGNHAHKSPVVSLATMKAFEGASEDGGIKWTLEDERKALVQVDDLTAKMRRRLFAKMASDGAIERKTGQKKPTTGLAAAELDIMPYEGMRPSRLRIEQQMMLRQEWKHLNKAQRKSMMLGAVTSNNAEGMDSACKECLKGESTCTKDGIVYENKAHKDNCRAVCLKWFTQKDTSAVCKCRIDCGAGGMSNKQLSEDAVSNYLSPRTLTLVPAEGVSADRCIPLNAAAAKEFKALKYRQPLWKPDQGTNFLLSFWWQPDKDKFTEKDAPKTLRSLVYKGVYPYTKTMPLHIEADLESGSPPYIKVTVGGQSFRSANRLHESQWSFIAVTKKDRTVKLYLGIGDNAYKEKPVVDSWMNLKATDLGGDPYQSSEDDSIYLVAPGADKDNWGLGFLGKLTFIQAQKWDQETGEDAITKLMHPISMWPAQIEEMLSGSKPKNCGF